MSVENKIKELLVRSGSQLTEATDGDKTQPSQGSSQKASFTNIATGEVKPSISTSKDTTIVAKSSGDATKPKQGDSKDAEVDEVDLNNTVGANAASSVSKDSTIKPKTAGDVTSPKQGSSDIKLPEEVDISLQIDSIFGEDLSEEFKTKATSIFEAAVIARVNSEMSKVIDRLEEQADIQLQEQLSEIVEKVDSYLSYVVEQWMDENALAVENGLRTEIAEDFISGLKTLFQESYIDIPEEKFDLVGELQQYNEELETKLNEEIEKNIEVSVELAELKRQQIFEEQTKDLAATEVEKLRKLVEGIAFDTEELYSEKVSVIKENYFPKQGKQSPERTLVEESNVNSANFETNDVMSIYAQAISRSAKAR